MKTEDLLKKVYELTSSNIAELITEFENNYRYNMELQYKRIYENENKEIIVVVLDKITKCQFELMLDTKTGKLEMA